LGESQAKEDEMISKGTTLILGLAYVLTLIGAAPAGGDKAPLVVATVCMDVKPDKEANLSKFLYYMEEASKQGANLVVFPEIALQQNPAWGASWYQPTQEELDYLSDTAETIPGDSTRKLVDKAKELGIYVIFGMTERGEDEELYNSSVFLGNGRGERASVLQARFGDGCPQQPHR